ncbi:MAG: Gfo/Idh/MocA family oxidoreductase [Pirellulaceae bacterium]
MSRTAAADPRSKSKSECQTAVDRRSFLQSTAAGAAVVGVVGQSMAADAAKAAGANDRIRIGFIGPGGRGFGAHVKTLAKLRADGRNIDLVSVCDVYDGNREQAANYIEKETGTKPKSFVDYNDLLADGGLDAVCIGTPDHWHCAQAVAAMKAGKHVYCEKPMTKTVEQATEIVDVWRETGKVMQVGVQSTSLPVWTQARQFMESGNIGKVLQFQTEFYRNSNLGQWRYYRLTKNMTPKTVDWARWLGVKEGLAEDRPFDRAIFAQWRRFFDFGAGMYTDLFVHRLTAMLKATGLLYPRRVVGGGGVYLEYDGREVPDVATVVADYDEGVQGLISATMCNEDARFPQLIRGHFGTVIFGNGEEHTGFDFLPERPQVTGISGSSRGDKSRIETGAVADTTYAHFSNWVDAMEAGKPQMCNNTPDLGAAAVSTVIMGARSYREGKVFFWDKEQRKTQDNDPGWSKQWEERSERRGNAPHIPGWKGGFKGSTLVEPEYQKLEGPWVNGKDPADA